MPRGEKFTAEQIIGSSARLRGVGPREAGARADPEAWRDWADFLAMEAGVRRAADGSHEATEGSRKGERLAEAALGGS